MSDYWPRAPHPRATRVPTPARDPRARTLRSRIQAQRRDPLSSPAERDCPFVMDMFEPQKLVFVSARSLLQVRVDNTLPIAWGLGRRADVMFERSPVFRIEGGAGSRGVRRIAWFDSATPLRSGWAWGQHYRENGVAAVEADVGRGRLCMFGPEITFRAQPHGTFKFLLNGIYNPTAASVTLR